MPIPFVIDNQQHRMSDALNELLSQTEGKLATALDADADELLFLAKRIPARMKRRILERPDAFRKLTELDDKALDRVLEGLHTG
jgi:hypothetical protein